MAAQAASDEEILQLATVAQTWRADPVAFVQHTFREDPEGHRVAVLACDPQSPLSGGALLGDRFRMGSPTDDGVFIDRTVFGGDMIEFGPAADLDIVQMSVRSDDRLAADNSLPAQTAAG